MEEFVYNGLWWLPDNPNNKVSGTLSFHPVEGIKLELIGSFKEIIDLEKDLTTGIIMGFTTDGKKITLYQCIENRTKLSMPGMLVSFFTANIVFIGQHFEREEDIEFKNLSINYSYLEDWINILAFENFQAADLDYNLRKYEVRYSFPQKIEAKLEGININIYHQLKKHQSRNEVVLKYTAFIELEPHNSLHFNDFEEYINNIGRFLSLAIGKAVYPLAIKGKTKSGITEIPDKKDYNVSIFYLIKGSPDFLGKLDTSKMLFSFSDISSNFEICLKNWFTKSELLKPVYDLYFATLYDPSAYLQFQFLSLAQAIESYHSRIYDGKYLSEEEYKIIYELLVEAIPREVDKEIKTFFKEKLQYLNQFSLRRRLKDIIKKLGNKADFLIDDIDGFINDVVNTRNYLTNYDRKLEDKVKKGRELYMIVQIIKFILEVSFLLELEIPKETVDNLVFRNQKYKNLRKILIN